MYYIYFGKMDGELVYIGKGKGDRFLHLNSGISSSYFANKAHFEGKSIGVEIVEKFDDEKEAFKRESFLIGELKPIWNYQVIGRKQRKNVKGVQRMKQKNGFTWRAYIHHNGKKVHIGNFETEEQAKTARKEYEVLNCTE